MTRPSSSLFLLFSTWVLTQGMAFCETPPPIVASGTSTYQVSGVLQSFDSKTSQATIAHDEIVGYMGAMTMSFDVANPVEFANLSTGDKLAFHLCVSGERAWIEQVTKTGITPSPLFAPAPKNTSRELGVGDLLPDVELLNERNEAIHLRDFRGNALAITFIYTRCPLPTYCPLMSRNFETAQSLLARLGKGENWRLLTISIDPEHDTPEALTEYARTYQADAQHWTFATATPDALGVLGKAVGLEFSQSGGGQISHNLRMVVVDSTGRIQRIFQGNRWTPQELVAESRAAMIAHH